MSDYETEMIILAIATSVLSMALFCMCCVCTRHDSSNKHVLTGEQRRKLMHGKRQPVASNVRETERFFRNSRGMALYTHVIEPRDTPPRAVVMHCHGFADNTEWAGYRTAERVCLGGSVAVAMIDYEGHGQSDGLSVLVPSFDQLCRDAASFFQSVKERYPTLPVFMYGESMGGAVALNVADILPPNFFSGVMLVAPMCKIADDMKPPQFVINNLIRLSHVFPTAAIAPVPDVLEKAFPYKEKLEFIKSSPICFTHKPRLATAREVLNASLKREERLSEVVVPFLVMHGGGDTVTDPKISQALYDQARSTDKTIKLYDGLCHALTCGETDENIQRVFSDLLAWMGERIPAKRGDDGDEDTAESKIDVTM